MWNEDEFRQLRQRMVREQLVARGIRDLRVLRAMETVPRHLFVPPGMEAEAYEDRPVGIAHGQTVSQPYIVAFMTEALEVEAGQKVLEIGTGSGYQTAILATLGARVFTVEIFEDLAVAARARLARLGLQGVRFRVGDGRQGWPEEAPFDRILGTAAPPDIPPPLLDQLAPGGRLVMPVGVAEQWIVLVVRVMDGRIVRRPLLPVRFVPMLGGGPGETPG